MSLKSILGFTLTSCICLTAFQAKALKVDNQDDLIAAYGMGMYPHAPEFLGSIKIAVLDNDFDGFDPKLGQLPNSAELIAGPKKSPIKTNHGLAMGSLAWAMTERAQNGPKIYLINAFGYANFKAAVDFVIKNKIDIVIYSQNWLYGSNFDGSGLFEPLVKRAADAGVIWLSSAGDSRGLSYSSSVLPINDSTGYVPLPDDHDTLRFHNDTDDNMVSINLSWSDFTADENYATDKDLDFYVYDSIGNEVTNGTLVQKGKAPPEGDTSSNLSALARESAIVKLQRGDYSIKVKVNSKNFTDSDRMRIVLKPAHPKMFVLFKANADDEVQAPADSPYVITVGDCSEISSRGTRLGKPDVVMPMSGASFSTDMDVIGSSNAVAILAGITSTLKAMELNFGVTELRSYLKTLKPDSRAGNYSCKTSPVWRTPSPEQLHKLIETK